MGTERNEDFAAAIAELEATGGEREQQDTSLGTDEAFKPEEKPAERTRHPFTPDGVAEAPTPGKERDTAGKFTPKTDAKDTVPSDQQPQKEGKPAQEVTQAPKPGESRAPASWKPEEREGWDKITPAHRAAIQRREAEVDNVLRTTADARKLHADFERVTRPYEAFYRAEGATALQAVENLFQTAAALRTSPPGQRAALVADLIINYGVDINTLDSVLSAKTKGQTVPGHAADPIVQLIQKELKPVREFMGSVQQTRQTAQQAMEQQATQTWTEFMADPKNEFAKDVSEDMADILDMATKRGQLVSLQDAYKRATLLHPTISGIVQSRQQASGSAQQTAAARRALNAAASIPGNGGAPSQDDEDPGDGSIRSDLNKSIRALSRGR